MIAASSPSVLLKPEYRSDSPHSVTDGTRRWPIVEGIPYLRVGREPLADAALAALDAGDGIEALALLLADRDDWDRTTPPSHGVLRELARSAATLTFREAMRVLAFGDVATYFAYRFGDPTFVAGLGLLAAHRPSSGRRSFEVACGTGHYVRELRSTGMDAGGGDVVFAKLWLARRYLAPDAGLVCFDAAADWPIASVAYDLVHLHDALYFLPRKTHVIAEMRRVACGAGMLAISHAHNAAVDNYSAGEPLTLSGYRRLVPGAIAYDDVELARAVMEIRTPVAGNDADLEGAAAFAVALRNDDEPVTARSCAGELAVPLPGTPLARNPVYVGSQVAWPSLRYEAEYAHLATYPERTTAPARAIMSADADIARFARTRELVALPARW